MGPEDGGVSSRDIPPKESRHMKGSLTKRLVYLMILGMFSLNFLTACNTVAGAGKDIEAAGDKIDDTATKEKND
jgi:predicted small secreted protein